MGKIYENLNMSINERVEDLLSIMTVEEKIGQMLQVSINIMPRDEFYKWAELGIGSFLHVLGEEAQKVKALAKKTRLKIPPIFGIDAIHGHALLNGATIFPSQLGMSCSWNTKLIHEMGRVTAKEVAADGLNWTFSPVLCVGRDLRWGRINETFGEDSYLIGELGAAIIDGYQYDNLIVACAKHYIAYGESTGGRDAYDTQISIRKVKETFLPPFKRAVDVGCGTFMSGYQSVDGTPITSNKKALRELLKEELKFQGFVVTDWMNIHSLMHKQFVAEDMYEATKMAIFAGNDMSMNSIEFYESAIKLVNDGVIPIELIDDSVKRILSIKFKLGLFDEEKEISREIIACEKHLNINKELTRESLVLLKNENNLLPISKDTKTIAVIGPNADDVQAQYGDWTFFSHPDPNPDAVPVNDYYTVLRGVKTVFENSNIIYSKGCDIINEKDEQIASAVEAAMKSDVVVAVVGDCLSQNGEFKDRANLELSGAQLDLLKALKQTGKPLVCVLVNGKPLCINWLKENCDALIESFNGGDFGGLAVAEALCGEFNPSGKLTISFPQHSAQSPIYYNQLPGWHSTKYVDVPSDTVYSFGYGLSYTEYKYDNLKLSKNVASKDDEIMVSVTVSNIGDVDGKEIVQLYVNDVISSIVTPIKQLKGFKKVEIKAGESVAVSIPLKISDLAIIDFNENYVVEPGEFEIMVGKNSNEYLKTSLIVK